MSTYIYAFMMLCILLGAHILGIGGLYFSLSWYDIMMHILGGFGIALFLGSLLKSYAGGKFFRLRTIVLAVLSVGIVWELFEIYFNITGHPLWSTLYYIDTVKDIIDDTIGGLIGGYLVVRFAIKSKMPESLISRGVTKAISTVAVNDPAESDIHRS